MSQTVDRPVDPKIAWSLEKRRQTMRDVITIVARAGGLRIENAHHFARSYGPGILVCEVEAEMMKHMQEGDAK